MGQCPADDRNVILRACKATRSKKTGKCFVGCGPIAAGDGLPIQSKCAAGAKSTVLEDHRTRGLARLVR